MPDDQFDFPDESLEAFTRFANSVTQYGLSIRDATDAIEQFNAVTSAAKRQIATEAFSTLLGADGRSGGPTERGQSSESKKEAKPQRSVAIGVCGTRTYHNIPLVRSTLLSIIRNMRKRNCTPIIVSGGAKGPDSAAENVASQLKLKCVVHTPRWEVYGKAAAYARNELIVEDSDVLLAFWDASSRGTRHTIELGVKSWMRVKIIHHSGVCLSLHAHPKRTDMPTVDEALERLEKWAYEVRRA